jgi:hypothetical protein
MPFPPHSRSHVNHPSLGPGMTKPIGMFAVAEKLHRRDVSGESRGPIGFPDLLRRRERITGGEPRGASQTSTLAQFPGRRRLCSESGQSACDSGTGTDQDEGRTSAVS